MLRRRQPAVPAYPNEEAAILEILLTPEQFAAKSRQLEQDHGLKLTGSEGILSKSGVKARYAYADGKLAVTIVEKPFIVSTAYCEEQVRKWLGSPA